MVAMPAAQDGTQHDPQRSIGRQGRRVGGSGSRSRRHREAVLVHFVGQRVVAIVEINVSSVGDESIRRLGRGWATFHAMSTG